MRRFVWIIFLTQFAFLATGWPDSTQPYLVNDPVVLDEIAESIAAERNAWPYIGGMGDPRGEIGIWKYLLRRPPDSMSLRARTRALTSVARRAVGLNRDYVDLLFKSRLMVEVNHVLRQEGKNWSEIDVYGCEVGSQTVPDRYPGGMKGAYANPSAPPRVPPKELPPSSRELSDLRAAGKSLCMSLRFQGEEYSAEKPMEDLIRRYKDLIDKTAALDAAASKMMSGSDEPLTREKMEALVQLVPKLKTSVVFSWMEEFESIRLEMDRRKYREPGISEIEFPLRDSVMNSRLPDCGFDVNDLLPASRYDSGKSRNLDSFLDYNEDETKFYCDSERMTPIEVGTGIPFCRVAARILVAIYAGASESASASGKSIYFRTTHVDRYEVKRGTRMKSVGEVEPQETEEESPVEYEEVDHIVLHADPFRVGRLLKSGRPTSFFVERFGRTFGEAVDEYRSSLRERIFRFVQEGGPIEPMHYALERLGLAIYFGSEVTADDVDRFLNWIGPNPASVNDFLRNLENRLQAELEGSRLELLSDLIQDGLGVMNEPRREIDLEIDEFRVRLLEHLDACVHTDPDRPAKGIVMARLRFSDALDANLRASLDRQCARKPVRSIRVLEKRARETLQRALPKTSPSDLDPIVKELRLDRPCGEKEQTQAILRLDAFEDAALGVVGLETYAAGGKGEEAFDADLALSIGKAKLGVEDLETELEPQKLAPIGQEEEEESCPEPDEEADLDQESYPMSSSGSPFRLVDDWNVAYTHAAQNRPYPKDLSVAGWHSKEHFLGASPEHRTELLPIGPKCDSKTSFNLRTLFSDRLKPSERLLSTGEVHSDSGIVSWRRRGETYAIDFRFPGLETTEHLFGAPYRPKQMRWDTLMEARMYCESHCND